MTADEDFATLFDDARPAYHVRSMEERKSIPRNGLVAVSTFSGCGGSSLGLKTAGWTIPYAVEFTPVGAETYRANAPETFVDERDIREIQPSDILDHIGLKPGELDLFEGSPPCSSFSSAGVRAGADFSERVGKVKLYSEGIHQRTDDLFEEWVRLVEGLKPKAVLAENVPDMAKPGAAQQYLFMIQGMLNDLGYEVWAKVYSSLAVGCATMRKRLILMGVRKDVGQVPRPFLSGSGYTVREALEALPGPNPEDELAWSWQDGTGVDPADGEHIPKCKVGPPECTKHPTIDGVHCAYTVAPVWHRLKPSRDTAAFDEKYITLGRAAWDGPCPTFLASGGNAGSSAIMHPDVCRRFTATEVKWMSGFPYDFQLTGHPGRRYERIARAVTPPLYEALGPYLERAIKGGR